MKKTKLTPTIVYRVMQELFPAINDYAASTYQEELQELTTFRILHQSDFEEMMLKHREKILAIDSESLDAQQIEWYRQEKTITDLDHKIEMGYWFAYPAFIRIALELEFGEEYERFANKRDGIG